MKIKIASIISIIIFQILVAGCPNLSSPNKNGANKNQGPIKNNGKPSSPNTDGQKKPADEAKQKKTEEEAAEAQQKKKEEEEPKQKKKEEEAAEAEAQQKKKEEEATEAKQKKKEEEAKQEKKAGEIFASAINPTNVTTPDALKDDLTKLITEALPEVLQAIHDEKGHNIPQQLTEFQNVAKLGRPNLVGVMKELAQKAPDLFKEVDDKGRTIATQYIEDNSTDVHTAAELAKLQIRAGLSATDPKMMAVFDAQIKKDQGKGPTAIIRGHFVDTLGKEVVNEILQLNSTVDEKEQQILSVVEKIFKTHEDDGYRKDSLDDRYGIETMAPLFRSIILSGKIGNDEKKKLFRSLLQHFSVQTDPATQVSIVNVSKNLQSVNAGSLAILAKTVESIMVDILNERDLPNLDKLKTFLEEDIIKWGIPIKYLVINESRYGALTLYLKSQVEYFTLGRRPQAEKEADSNVPILVELAKLARFSEVQGIREEADKLLKELIAKLPLTENDWKASSKFGYTLPILAQPGTSLDWLISKLPDNVKGSYSNMTLTQVLTSNLEAEVKAYALWPRLHGYFGKTKDSIIEKIKEIKNNIPPSPEVRAVIYASVMDQITENNIKIDLLLLNSVEFLTASTLNIDRNIEAFEKMFNAFNKYYDYAIKDQDIDQLSQEMYDIDKTFEGNNWFRQYLFWPALSYKIFLMYQDMVDKKYSKLTEQDKKEFKEMPADKRSEKEAEIFQELKGQLFGDVKKLFDDQDIWKKAKALVIAIDALKKKENPSANVGDLFEAIKDDLIKDLVDYRKAGTAEAPPSNL